MKQIVCFLVLFFNTVSWGQFVGTPYIVPIGPSFQNTIVFQAINAQQTWTVPAGVTKISVELLGAQGGGTNAGKGGKVTAQLTVTPGATLIIVVGSQPAGRVGVYGGGGNGGTNNAATSTFGYEGGGLAGIYLTSVSRLNALAIAGGGGGNSGLNGKLGGNAGAPNGTNGGQGNFNNSQQEGGRGATQSAGGAAGVSFDTQTQVPTAGTQLNGGRGGFVNIATWTAGGGGGAGYYGGGGGAGGGASVGAGGGGSSFVSATAGTNIIYTSGFNTGNGKITISF
jgi:hypothetical protein